MHCISMHREFCQLRRLVELYTWNVSYNHNLAYHVFTSVVFSYHLFLFVFLRSLCVDPLPPRQRRRNRRSVPQPQRDPRTRSQPSCSPTRTCLLHTLLLYGFYYHKYCIEPVGNSCGHTIFNSLVLEARHLSGLGLSRLACLGFGVVVEGSYYIQ